MSLGVNKNYTWNLGFRYQQEYSPVIDKSVQDNDFKKFMANVNYKLYALDNLDIGLTTGVSYDAEERVSHNQSLNDYYVFNNTELLGVYYLNDIFTLKGGYGFDLELFNNSPACPLPQKAVYLA